MESDHKPLEAITKKQLSATPPRLQRMLLQLQKYSFTLKYKPDKEMLLADTLSRAYLEDEPPSEDLGEDLVCAVNQVISNLPVSDAKLEVIRQATANDPVMLKLQDTIKCGWPTNRFQVSNDLKPYWTFREELSEADGILLKGEKIMIPSTLRKDMLAKINTSHLGVVKCKQRAKNVFSGQECQETLRNLYPHVTSAYNISHQTPKSP